MTRQTVKKETICSGLGKRLQPCMYIIQIIKYQKISLFKIDYYTKELELVQEDT